MMGEQDFSVIGLSRLKPLRQLILSGDPALLFSTDFHKVLWANSAGARFFGGDGLARLTGTRFESGHPLLRQFKSAADQIRNGVITRGFRVLSGGKTRFIQFELSRIAGADGEAGILVVCHDDRYRLDLGREDALRRAIDIHAGLADGIAFIAEDGQVLASDDAFRNAGLSESAIREIVEAAGSAGSDWMEGELRSETGGTVPAGIGMADPRNRIFFLHVEKDRGTEGADVPVTAAEAPAAGHVPALQQEPEQEFDEGEEQSAPPPVDSEEPEPLPEETEITAPEPAPAIGESPEAAFENDEEPEPAEHAGSAATAGEAPARTEEPQRRGPIRSFLDRWYMRQGDIEDSAANLTGRNQREAEASKPPEEERETEEETDAITADAPVAEDEPLATANAGVVSDEVEAADATDEGDHFVFESGQDPVRIAWVVDADGRFRSVSPELGRTVGPNAADIVGRVWREVASVFGFDRNGEIEKMMQKRDTWSGKSVLWPVQGTDLVVPIDLAALPAYDSSRRFDGFRGFGIIRTADAIVDPDETGLALGPASPAPDGGSDEPDGDGTSTPDGGTTDAKGMKIADSAGEPRGPSSNIVDLATIRQKPGQRAEEIDPRLSGREASAFMEIGRRLGGSRQTEAGPALDEEEDDRAAMDHLEEEEAGARERAEAATAAEAVDNSPYPAVAFMNAAILHANQGLLSMGGFASVDEIVASGGLEALIAASEAGGQTPPEMRLVCKDGRQLPVRPRLHTIRTADGAALLLTLRPAEDDLAGSQTQGAPAQSAAVDMIRVSELQSILDTATDGVIVATREGHIESVNGPAEKLFGRPLSELVGEPVTCLFAAESHEPVRRYLAGAEGVDGPAGGEPGGELEVTGLTANGGSIPLFISIGRVGRTEKRCIVLRDITRWKKAEEELVSARRAAESASEQKTDFLARVSHEIRTPLNAIIGFSDVMIEERFGPVGSDRYREYLRDINRSGVHVLDLINDLLDISKIEAGKMDLSYEAVDLNQIVSETVALLQPQANSDRIIIRTSLSRAVPRVVADPRSIRQIILNLVSNAIKFTQMNGHVIVSTVYEANGEVVLRVRDTGRGMTKHELEHAMKPFNRINVADEKRGQGTGLGLPLTKALVEANRAHFDLQSTPGEGTIAHVNFPASRVMDE